MSAPEEHVHDFPSRQIELRSGEPQETQRIDVVKRRTTRDSKCYRNVVVPIEVCHWPSIGTQRSSDARYAAMPGWGYFKDDLRARELRPVTYNFNASAPPVFSAMLTTLSRNFSELPSRRMTRLMDLLREALRFAGITLRTCFFFVAIRNIPLLGLHEGQGTRLSALLATHYDDVGLLRVLNQRAFVELRGFS